MTGWRHNNVPHRNALHFGVPGPTGIRNAKHAKGNWQVYPHKGRWRAWRTTVGSTADLGTFDNAGLAMSACAKDCKERP